MTEIAKQLAVGGARGVQTLYMTGHHANGQKNTRDSEPVAGLFQALIDGPY